MRLNSVPPGPRIGRLHKAGVIGVVRASRAFDLGSARALASDGAHVLDIEFDDTVSPGRIDLLAAPEAVALQAARLAVDADVPLLVFPDGGVPAGLGSRLPDAPMVSHRLLTYRTSNATRLALTEVHVSASSGDNGCVRICTDTATRQIAEPVPRDGVRFVSSLPLPSWSVCLPVVHPEVGAVALADGGSAVTVRAVLPHDAVVYLTGDTALTVTADRSLEGTVAAQDALYLGPHDAMLRLVVAPAGHGDSRAPSDLDAGLGRFARRVAGLAHRWPEERRP